MDDARSGPGWDAPKLTPWCGGISWSSLRGETSMSEAQSHRECRTSGGWRMCACLCHVPQWIAEVGRE